MRIAASSGLKTILGFIACSDTVLIIRFLIFSVNKNMCVFYNDGHVDKKINSDIIFTDLEKYVTKSKKIRLCI